jgi:hypothetical protein
MGGMPGMGGMGGMGGMPGMSMPPVDARPAAEKYASQL